MRERIETTGIEAVITVDIRKSMVGLARLGVLTFEANCETYKLTLTEPGGMVSSASQRAMGQHGDPLAMCILELQSMREYGNTLVRRSEVERVNNRVSEAEKAATV